MNKKTLDTTEVLTPIWVLKAKVEQDFEEFKVNNLFEPDDNLVSISILDWEEDEEPVDTGALASFPEFDSTIKCLEILEKYNIVFNSKSGTWN